MRQLLQRVLHELGEVRNEQHQMRQELAAIHSGKNEIAVEVAVLGGNVRDVKRIERHTGLVKA